MKKHVLKMTTSVRFFILRGFSERTDPPLDPCSTSVLYRDG